MSAEFHLNVALIHYPVVNRNGEIIGSAVTNLDLHDIARAGRTFGVSTYWVVTPYPQQQELAAGIVSHWTEGYGSRVNSDRAEALSIIRIIASLDGVLAELAERHGRRPKVVATSAGGHGKAVDYAELRHELLCEKIPALLLLGTGWGLAPEVMAQADAVLPPIKGRGDFNHLSVRSAAAIILDRLLGARREDRQYFASTTQEAGMDAEASFGQCPVKQTR